MWIPPSTAASSSASITRRPKRVRQRLGSVDATGAAAGARALGDPTRLRLALALAEGHELCVCDLAWIVGRSDKLVLHHVRTLRNRGHRAQPPCGQGRLLPAHRARSRPARRVRPDASAVPA